MTGLRIVEASPEIGNRLMGLEAAMKDAAIELALEHVDRKGNAVDGCFRCGVNAKPGVDLNHQSSCAVGRILAYVEAVCDQRMADLVVAEPKPAEPAKIAVVPQPAGATLTGGILTSGILTSEDHRYLETHHVEYEVPEHPWAGEEGNCPQLGRKDRGAR